MAFGPVWLMQPIPYFGEKIKGKWIYEPKIDGWRMQILRYPDGTVECWGRRLERKPNWSKKLSKISAMAAKIFPKGTIIDCELFSSRGRRFIPSLFAKKPKAKPIVCVFDAICLRGKNISALRLSQRKKILQRLAYEPPFFLILAKNLTNIKRNFNAAISNGSEGIVIKKLNSPYLIGKDAPIATHYWRKIK